MYYYLSIGSNINPTANVVKIISWLVKTFEYAVLYPVIETQPEHLSSENTFLNTLAIIYSEIDAVELKQQFNRLEESLGRNRNDPERSHKDRPADLDILEQSEEFRPEIFAKYTECYIRKVYGLEENAIRLSVDQSFLGDRPSTIYFDRTSGQIRIINNKFYGFDDWIKSGFVTE